MKIIGVQTKLYSFTCFLHHCLTLPVVNTMVCLLNFNSHAKFIANRRLYNFFEGKFVKMKFKFCSYYIPEFFCEKLHSVTSKVLCKTMPRKIRSIRSHYSILNHVLSCATLVCKSSIYYFTSFIYACVGFRIVCVRIF